MPEPDNIGATGELPILSAASVLGQGSLCHLGPAKRWNIPESGAERLSQAVASAALSLHASGTLSMTLPPSLPHTMKVSRNHWSCCGCFKLKAIFRGNNWLLLFQHSLLLHTYIYMSV